MPIELVLVVLLILAVVTSIARLTRAGRSPRTRPVLPRRIDDSVGMWAVRAITGRVGRRPDEPPAEASDPERSPGELSPVDRLAALMGDGGPGEEPTSRPPVAPSPVAPRARPNAAIPMATPIAASSILLPSSDDAPSPHRPMSAAGLIGDSPSQARARAAKRDIDRRRRLYRDAAVVLFAGGAVVLGALAFVPGGLLAPTALASPSASPTIIVAVASRPPSQSASPSAAPTPSPTAAATPVLTPSASPSPSPSPTPILTPAPTPKPTPRPTPRPTPAPTPTPTPAPVARVTVSPGAALLVASGGVCMGSVKVTVNGSASSNATSYRWSFGDGATATTAASKTTHTYHLATPLPAGQEKRYTVKLTVSNKSGTDSSSTIFRIGC